MHEDMYRGLAQCPDDAVFRAAVARRLSGDWEALPGERARRLDVVVSRAGEGYVATIELLNSEGRRLRRAVRGRDRCHDRAQALDRGGSPRVDRTNAARG